MKTLKLIWKHRHNRYVQRALPSLFGRLALDLTVVIFMIWAAVSWAHDDHAKASSSTLIAILALLMSWDD